MIFFVIAIGLLVGQAEVIDGDTIRVGKQAVRLFGLDAPEMHQPGGPEAKAALQDIFTGQPISCEPTGDVSYNRIVARCYVRDQELTRIMIERGFGSPYCRFAGSEYDDAARASDQKPCGD